MSSLDTAHRSPQGDHGDGHGKLRRRHFRPDIQALRALAVVLVVVHHFTGWPAGGFIGVDVFFVISGYLITDLLVREITRSGRISLREFYARRMRRIFPMAVTVLVVTVAFAFALFTPARADSTLIDAIWAFLFVENWNLALASTDYFQMGNSVSAVQQYWSLSVEEQYYLVWPVVMIALTMASTWVYRRRKDPRIPRGIRQVASASVLRLQFFTLAIVLISLASFAWAIVQTANAPSVAYFSTFTRAWELALGALVALAVSRRRIDLTDNTRGLITVVGVGAIFVSAVVINESTPFPGPWALAPVIATSVVLAFGGKATGWGTRYLRNPVPQFLGQISYSLYLWHWPIMIFLFAVFSPSVLTVVSGIALSVALSIASYYLIEQPVRDSSWLSAKRASSPLVRNPSRIDEGRRVQARVLRLGILAVAAVGLVAIFLAGLQPRVANSVTWTITKALTETTAPRIPETTRHEDKLTIDHYTALKLAQRSALTATEMPNIRLAAGWNDTSAATATEECASGPDRSAICDFPESGATKLAVLFGDSQLQAWLPGLRKAFRGQGYHLRVFAMPGCTSVDVRIKRFMGYDYVEHCEAFRAQAFNYIAERKPTLVVLSSLAESASGQVDAATEQERADNWAAGWNSSLAKVSGHTQKIVVLESPPFGRTLEDCQTRYSSPSDCRWQLSEERRYYQGLNAAAVAAAADSGLPVHYVSVEDWFCDEGNCASFLGNIPIYADSFHASPEYSRYLAGLLRQSIIG